MITAMRALVTIAALLGAVTLTSPVSAQVTPTPTPDGTFYEVTENMRMIARRKPHRVAQAALVGTARVGSAFCPTTLVRAVSATASRCLLNAIGEDDISLLTGQGTFDAKLTIVVQEQGTIDAPETVVGKLRASGTMDFSPAFLQGLAYGTITGRVHVVGSDDPGTRFFGVFRLPVAGCTPEGSYLFYDGTTIIGCVAVAPNEYSIGFPTVRFEVWDQ